MAELCLDIVIDDGVDIAVVDDATVDVSAVDGDLTVVEVPGIRGPRGFQGDQGIQGERGERGDTGSTGPAGTITIGDVSTGDPGADAIVENVGSDTAAVLNFVVPQGPQGVAGVPGQRGDTGATGAQGVQGLQGERGERGDTGATGSQGIQGIQGIPGERGERGEKGDTGATGAQGAAGVSLDIQGSVATYGDLPVDAQPGDAWIVLTDGKLYYRDATGFPSSGQGVPFQGPQGIQGIPGIQGERGDTGATGAQGIQGIPGEPGAVGATGATGAQGIQGIQGPAGADGRGYTWRGTFSSSETYAVDDVVGFNGSTYLCLIGGTTQSPVAAPSRWALMALRGDTGATGATGATGPQGAAGTTSWSGITDVPSTLVYTDAAQTLTQKTLRFSDGVPAVTHATNGNLLQFSTIASGDSYIEIANNLSGTAPRVSAVGSATNVPIAIGSKGVGNIFFRANSSANSFAVTSAVSSGSVNYLQANQVAAGGTPSFSVAGSADANVSINLVPKGTGTVQANGVPILTRSIQTVTSAITLGNNQNTDYVAFIGASGSVTLPTAVGNTSRYTIKCIDSASKTVSSTSSQTIDGATTYTLAQNVSIDLVSDGSNWRIV